MHFVVSFKDGPFGHICGAVGNEDLEKDLVRTYYRQSVSEVLSHFRERIEYAGSDISFGSSCIERILRLETGKLGVNWEMRSQIRYWRAWV